MDILVTVVNQKLRIATNLQNLVSGSQDFIRFIFDLSSDWDDMTTFAQFQQSGIAYNRSLDENNAVYFPQEIRAGTCKMTLYGSGNGKTGTTNNVTLYVDENTFVYDAIPGDGVPEALSDRLSQIEDSIRNVSIAISGKYTLPAGGIPYNDLSSAVQQMITNNGGGGGSVEPIIVQGDTSTTYGFATQAALTSFRNDYPNAFKQGDYVWVKDGDYASHTYTLYVVNQNKQLSDVFKIGDTLVVTVSSGNNNQLSVNKTIAQINTELNNGKNIALRTEYGVVLNPTYHTANGIYFTTVADFDGEFYARTYSITGNGLSVSTKSLSEGTGFKVISVIGDDETGYEVDLEHSDFTIPAQLNQIMGTEYNEDVRMKINGAVLPCVSTDAYSAQFSGLAFGYGHPTLVCANWDGYTDEVTVYQIRTEDLALKSDIISGGGSGGGSGSGSDVTEATVAAWGFIKNLQSEGYGYATNSQSAATTARTASLTGFVLTTGGNVVVKFTNSVPANATLNVNSTGAKNIRYRGANITSGIINGGDLVSFRYDGTYYIIESIDKSQYLVPSTGIPLSDLSSNVQTILEKADTAVQPSDLGNYVEKSALAAKTSAHTQAVTVDESTGALYVLPPGDGGSSSAPVSLPSLGEARGSCTTAANTVAKTVTLADYVLVNGNLVQIRFSNNVPASATLNINSTGAKPIYYKGSAITADIIFAGDVALLTYNSTLVSGGAYNLITTSRAYLIPSGGIPGTDLSIDVQNAILANKHFISFNSADGITGTLANVTSIDDLYNLWYGNKYYVALDYSEYGDYEFPLVFIDSGKDHAVFAGVFRDASTGVAKIATFYASESNNTVTAIKTVTTPGSGGGVPSGGWTESDLSSSVLNNLYMAGGMVSNGETYATTTRSINIAGYRLVTGAMFTVKFTYKLKANSKLQVSADGGTTYTADKYIHFGSSQLAEDQIKAGDTITFRYDGNYYQVIARIPATPESISGGGGVTIYSVDIVYDTGYWYIRHDGLDIAAEDIFTALNGGALVQVVDDGGAECELMAISYSPGAGLLVYKSCNMDNDVPEWRMFTIQDEIVQSAPRADVTMTQVDLLPLSDSRTASAVGSGFTVAGNTVYTVSGTISGFSLANSSLPTMLPGQCIEIRLTVGSTAISSPTWPSGFNFMGGWDGKFSANTYYDILIDDAGNVFAATREVTA